MQYVRYDFIVPPELIPSLAREFRLTFLIYNDLASAPLFLPST